jgi:SAM-dependent methyltransferase
MRTDYRNRPLVSGFPDLERLGVEWYAQHQETETDEAAKTADRLARLIGPPRGRPRLAVIGCGPRPAILRGLAARGYDAIGVEPLADAVGMAREYLAGVACVEIGAAESLPFEDESVEILILESVLEHVDSPTQSLVECFRVLKPGGVLYVSTTNRHAFSITGRNGEFRIPFYNWFPRLLKESYVFQHLHYRPELANFSPRPAVHWFSYTDLCREGRYAGFAQFYSLIDLLDESSPAVQHHLLRRVFLGLVKHNALMRSIALIQFGGSIFMLKRPSPSDNAP